MIRRFKLYVLGRLFPQLAIWPGTQDYVLSCTTTINNNISEETREMPNSRTAIVRYQR